MQVGIPRETLPGETRVAATPETVKKLVQAGHRVRVERGAGTAARHPDAEYERAGAELTDADAALGGELVLKVRRPEAAELDRMKPGTVLLPQELAPAVDRLLRTWRDVERQGTPYKLIPMAPGADA